MSRSVTRQTYTADSFSLANAGKMQPALPIGSLQKSNVDGNFKMLVPIYFELEDGRVVFLGRARMLGATSFTGKIPLKNMKTKPRRAMINHYDDVLSAAN